MKKHLDNLQSKRIVFLGLQGNQFSRSKNFHHGLLKLGQNSDWLEINPGKKITELLAVKEKYLKQEVLFVVSSPSHLLVPFARLLLRQNIFLDAGWPLYDGVVLSRKEYGFLGWRVLLTYLIDLISFHSASIVFLESETQLHSCKSKYMLKRSKLDVLNTGFDENRFLGNKSKGGTSTSSTTVLFRGGPQQEAGLEVLKTAIVLLQDRQDINFVVASRGFNGKNFRAKNLSVYSINLPDVKLWELYDQADIVLGQLSRHSRLRLTLPHKFYEAGFFKKCYLTSNYGVIKKYVKEARIKGFEPGDSQSLVDEILLLTSNKKLRDGLGKNLGNLYQSDFSQDVLTKKFVVRITN